MTKNFLALKFYFPALKKNVRGMHFSFHGMPFFFHGMCFFSHGIFFEESLVASYTDTWAAMCGQGS